jgi:nucleotide-binding universal stress UspA family protein
VLVACGWSETIVFEHTMAVTTRKQNKSRGRRGATGENTILGDIMCGLDGTRTAYEAVRQAAALAQPNGRLELVVVTGGGTAAGKRNVIEQTVISPMRARRVLQYAARLAREAGLRAEAELDERGPVREVLLERAHNHTLLALGAPAMSRHAHILIGGVASAAVHTLPVSLLVARHPPAGVPFAARIVLASDALARSDGLLELGIDLARKRKAELVVVHAARAESRFRPARIARQSERIRDALGKRGRMCVIPGHAGEMILQCAAQERASLLVLGSRRVGGVRALGSVSERLVHDASCSVLIVRPEDQRA